MIAEFGTALGLYRDHDLIPHDNDIDLSVPSGKLNKIEKICYKFQRENKFVLSFQKDLDRSRHALITINLMYENLSIPISIYQRFYGNNESFCTGERFGTLPSSLFKERYSLIIPEGEFQLPCPPDLYLANLYGEDWGKPDMRWTYHSYRNLLGNH